MTTASKTSLILSECRHWMSAHLSDERGLGGEAAQFGTKVHKFVEDYLTLNKEDLDVEMGINYGKPAEDLLKSIGCGPGIILEQAMFATHQGEFGFIESYDEVKDLQNKLCGTADVLHSDGDAGIVLDWKTGNGLYARNQLMSLAAMFAEIMELASVRMLSVELRPGEAKPVLDFTMTREQLKVHLDNVLDRIHKGPTAPIVGSHCYDLWCPHREACVGIRDKFYSASNSVKRLNVLSNKELYEAFVSAKVSEANAEEVRKRIQQECTSRGGLKLENGTFQETFRSVKRLQQSELLQLAKSKGVTDAEIDACKRDCIEGAGWRLKK
jgi:hypothetical protein